MAAVDVLQATTPLARDAARWFARMARAPQDHPDRGRFEAWLAASPAHAAEYARYAEVWDDFDSSLRLERLTLGLEAKRARERVQRLSRRGALQATVLGLATVGLGGLLGWRLWNERQSEPVLVMDRETQPGQLLEQPLPDGSKLTLAPDTRLSVRHYRDRREVDMNRGEAIFDVARDVDRPFVVRSGPACVTVLGTRFVVSQVGAERVRVSVLHGRVRVEQAASPRAEASATGVTLGADEVAEVLADQLPQRVNRRADDAVAWRQGTLVFDGDPLTDVAQRLSRFSGMRVTADGLAAHPARITAVVQLRDAKAFLRSLPGIADVRVVDELGGVRLVRP